ncbi:MULTISPECIES: L,D-transpeptidase family protein [unclassified Sinorhizobium]|uniref:L,D-transpeptidase family protein n=1 Tax=unclassified Sinorhizobium TaxID=2613772 RepID=UPI0035250C98
MLSRFFFGLGLLSATALVHPVLAGDARTLQIVVSKDRQSLVVYDGSTVVATSKVSTGKDGHHTPSGIFSILEKERYHESNIYSNSPMPFMQRLTWSGIALHESSFVPGYPASHGCVRMPKAFAKMLYEMTERGVHVIIGNEPVIPRPFNHTNLFHPEAPEAPPLLSDAILRPSIPYAAEKPVQVAMNDTKTITDAVANVVQDQSPIRILITRRGLPETVIELQRLLNQLGFSAGDEDGLLGPDTVEAINAFKQSHPLDFENDKGLISQALLRAVYAAAGKGEPPNGVIMVRQDFKPLLEASVTIADPQMPLGTHFLTLHSMDRAAGKAEWYSVTLANRLSKDAMKRLGIASRESSFVYDETARALDRIIVPEETRRRIDDLLSAGSSLTISDTGLGPETGKGTDFITLTRD